MSLVNNISFNGRFSVRTGSSSGNEPVYEKQTYEFDKKALDTIELSLNNPDNNRISRLVRAIKLDNGNHLYGFQNGLEIKNESSPYLVSLLTLTFDNIKNELQPRLKDLLEKFNQKMAQNRPSDSKDQQILSDFAWMSEMDCKQAYSENKEE